MLYTPSSRTQTRRCFDWSARTRSSSRSIRACGHGAHRRRQRDRHLNALHGTLGSLRLLFAALANWFVDANHRCELLGVLRDIKQFGFGLRRSCRFKGRSESHGGLQLPVPGGKIASLFRLHFGRRVIFGEQRNRFGRDYHRSGRSERTCNGLVVTRIEVDYRSEFTFTLLGQQRTGKCQNCEQTASELMSCRVGHKNRSMGAGMSSDTV